MKTLVALLAVGMIGFGGTVSFACDCGKDKAATCEEHGATCKEHGCDGKSCAGMKKGKKADKKADEKKQETTSEPAK